MLGILSGIIAAAFIILISNQPTGDSIHLLPAPTASPLTIDISGAIKYPGLYKLQPGSRLNDAVLAAGGLIDAADRELINLARLIHDGEKVYIPIMGEEKSRYFEFIAEGADSINPGYRTGKININKASLGELQLLPGIGEVKAGQIIEYREAHGNFDVIDEITNVPGIGIDTYERIKDLISTE